LRVIHREWALNYRYKILVKINKIKYAWTLAGIGFLSFIPLFGWLQANFRPFGPSFGHILKTLGLLRLKRSKKGLNTTQKCRI
jgi:hypothetical protein